MFPSRSAANNPVIHSHPGRVRSTVNAFKLVIMIERYKVLGAMLTLRQFSVADLAKFSRVKRSTVYTVLNREHRFIEEIDRLETGRRGGRIAVYRIKDDQIEELRADIKRLFGELGVASAQTSDAKPTLKVPLGWLAAADGLKRLYPKAESAQEKRQIVDRAKRGLRSGRADLKALLARGVDGYAVQGVEMNAKPIEALIELCEAELAAERIAANATVASTQEITEFSVLRSHIERAHAQVLFWKDDDFSSTMIPSGVQEQIEGPGEMDGVVLVDGIQENNLLTERVSSALKTNDIFTQPADVDHLSSIVRELAGSSSRQFICLLMVNSERYRNRAENACRSILEHCDDKGRVFIFDVGSDDVLRNRVKEQRAHYEPYAIQLNPAAIMSTLFWLK